jgi:hypothetical protein
MKLDNSKGRVNREGHGPDDITISMLSILQ